MVRRDEKRLDSYNGGKTGGKFGTQLQQGLDAAGGSTDDDHVPLDAVIPHMRSSSAPGREEDGHCVS